MLFERTTALVGNLDLLSQSKILIVGLGGVGGPCAEALARAGVGNITLCDGDVVTESNINRQIVALHSTVGKKKCEVMAERIGDINPDCSVTVRDEYLTEENIASFGLKNFDYIADCIDSVRDKVALIEYAVKNGIKIVSCMGTGNKLSCDFKVADLAATTVCPLARTIRSELRKRGVEHVKTVFSAEQPKVRPVTPSSISYVPPVAGLTLAGEIIKSILFGEDYEKNGLFN